jgi:hypothetical protein
MCAILLKRGITFAKGASEPAQPDACDLENSERNIWPPMCMLLGRDRNGKYLEIEIGTASDGISRPRHLLACLVGFP